MTEFILFAPILLSTGLFRLGATASMANSQQVLDIKKYLYRTHQAVWPTIPGLGFASNGWFISIN